jgi:hypothetical protein
MLKFSPANAKLAKLAKALRCKSKVYSLDLSAGKTCPGAKDCRSTVITINGKHRIKDGEHCEHRCYAASLEALYPSTFSLHQHNHQVLKGCRSTNQIVDMLEKALPPDAKIIRYHSSGDFFKQSYFDAAIKLAQNHPNIRFYAYTKSLPFWVKRLGEIPDNFVLTASVGGKYDHLIDEFNLRSATVVFSEKIAKSLGLKLDKTDKLAATPGPSFALLLHGPQPKDSLAAKAWQLLKKIGKAGYSRKG